MEYIYFGTTNGGLIDNYDIAKIARIVNGTEISALDFESIKQFAKTCKGIKGEIKRPSVKYLLQHGDKIKATQIYYRQYEGGITLLEARTIVDKMEKEMNEQTK
jgi:hypothetical protein